MKDLGERLEYATVFLPAKSPANQVAAFHLPLKFDWTCATVATTGPCLHAFQPLF